MTWAVRDSGGHLAMRAHMRGADPDTLVIGFPDVDSFGRPVRSMLSTLESHLVGRLLVEERWPSAEFTALKSSLGQTAQPYRQVLCVGIGAGARAALLYGQVLRAKCIVVWAPSGGPVAGIFGSGTVEETFGVADPDDLDRSAHVTSAVDTAVADIALARTLRPAAAGIRLERIEGIPFLALDQALAHTGIAAEVLSASIGGRPIPKVHDLLHRWQAALAYRIEVDRVPRSTKSGAGVEIHGTFQNCSTKPFDLDFFERDLIRIGAKIVSPGDDPHRPHGARFALAGGKLAPGASIPFQLMVSEEIVSRGFDARVSLVCEGRFWFDDHGFSYAAMSVPAATTTARSDAA